jgi:hypothetical protein
MEFRVFTTGEGLEPYNGSARYEVANNGVLTVYDDGGRQTVYGPFGWLKIEVGPPALPHMYEDLYEHEDF